MRRDSIDGFHWVTASGLIFGEPPCTYGKGRICATEGCGTRLSRYNPKTALFNPLKEVKEMQCSPSRRRTSMVHRRDRSESERLSAGCERFHADIAVLVVGGLGGDEDVGLLDHLEGCPRCELLRAELADVVKVLETSATR